MAITFVGYYRVQDGAFSEADFAHTRGTGQFPDSLQEKVRGLPAVLPETCKLIGSWNPAGGEVPGVIVVEAQSHDDLQVINAHYSGWLMFDWHPVATGGVERN